MNNAMYKRPYLTPLLFDVLIRFRLNTIGIIADIDKAYFHISEADCHRDFVFISEGTIFRFCRVVFGANCSQYLLNSVIPYNAGQYKDVDKILFRKSGQKFLS